MITPLEMFYNYLVNIKGYQEVTAYQYKRTVTCFFESYPELTINTYEAFIQSLREKGLTSSTISTNSLAIRCYAKFCNKHGIPCAAWQEFEVPRRIHPQIDIPRQEEVIAVIEQVTDYQDKLFYKILYESGCRLSEVMGLTPQNINGDQFTVMGKGNKPRLCFMSIETSWQLKSYIDMFNVRGKIFNKSKVHYQYTLTQAGKKLGIKIHPHILRHAFATQMLTNGADTMTVKELLGHEQLQTTQRYLHITDNRKQEQYRKYRPSYPQ